MDKVIAIFRRSIAKMLGRLAVGVVVTGACALVAFRALPAVAPGSRAALLGAAGFVFFGLVTIVLFLQAFRAVGQMNAAAGGFSISMAGLDGSFDDLITAIKKANAVAAKEGP